ncbi:Ubiquitin associated translation elongation factor EF1B [Paragonimus heterotremus]|uniref:Ubiquitin associated translation elongation factor EF1B n=1 Tax=Paragonimus heterotremus TaxID=100268 RepID=A0A8J4WG40_9TREM|nr:Ubiquitin associated translation elongation factor EF1B [Paragonimus heterotremus]
MQTDLRELGSSWFADNRKTDQLETGGRVVQIVRIRNIAIPLADEDIMLTSTSTVSQSGPRLFRLTLTDGRTTVMALDVDNHEKLSLNTPPGTKLRLMGTIPIHLGFLVLRKQDFQVLGGNVSNLIKEWTMTKLAKSCEGRGIGGGHPFVPFGSEEAAALVKAESRFLQSLHSGRDRAFDSFKLAITSQSSEKENEFDADFMERRKDVIAEVKKTANRESNFNSTPTKQPVSNRFRVGGSRFYELQSEKAQAYDASLAQLVSMGYGTPLALNALKLHHGDHKAALDYLLAKQVANTCMNGTGRGSSARPSSTPGRRSRGRGRRGGRGGFDPMEEDDPYFDPAAAAAAAGLPSRPSTGKVRLDDLLSDARQKLPSTRENIVSTTTPSRPSGSTGPAFTRLPIGCPILAQNMQGEYEEAQLMGHLPSAGCGGDKVVLVVYSRTTVDNIHGTGASFEEPEEELVPLSLIRTLNKERITLDMVPPAPPERAQPYSLLNQGRNPRDQFSGASNRRVFRGRSTGRRFRGRYIRR